MSIKLHTQSVDIYHYPKAIFYVDSDAMLELTVGDLHGHAIKLLYLLIEHGVVKNIGPSDYKSCVDIYLKSTDELSIDDLDTFKRIIDALIVSHPLKIRLIGDELADRGRNDYFTLVLLDKIRQCELPIEILVSNHGLEFIQAFESQKPFKNKTLSPECTNSMHQLQKLLDRGLIKRQTLEHIYQHAYLPFLKLVSYTYDPSQRAFVLYSHAAIGLENVEYLALRMGVAFFDETPFALKMTIDAINLAFKQYLNRREANTLYSLQSVSKVNKKYTPSVATAIEFVAWNRNYDMIDRPPMHTKGRYSLYYVHGHEWSLAPGNPRHVFNLDNVLGKDDTLNAEFSYVLYSGLKPEYLLNSKHLEGLKGQLRLIKHKAQSFKDANDLRSYEAVIHLHKILKKGLRELLQTSIDVVEFKTIALGAIKKARLALSKEPQWGEVFSHSYSLIGELGVRCYTAGIVSKLITGKFLFFQKESLHLLDIVEDEVKKKTEPSFNVSILI